VIARVLKPTRRDRRRIVDGAARVFADGNPRTV
jgi:hypothetical protein